MIMNVIPIYGNGWTDGLKTIDEPIPFQIDVNDESSSDRVLGMIVTTGHDFFGWIFEASPRFHNDRTIYDCTLGGAVGTNDYKGRSQIYGYCQIPGDITDEASTALSPRPIDLEGPARKRARRGL